MADIEVRAFKEVYLRGNTVFALRIDQVFAFDSDEFHGVGYA